MKKINNVILLIKIKKKKSFFKTLTWMQRNVKMLTSKIKADETITSIAR